MSPSRVRCQVLETPACEDWLPRGADWPRDLLPWADPYIATIMVRLERRYDWGGPSASAGDNPWDAEPDPGELETADLWSADDAPFDSAAFSAAFFGDEAFSDEARTSSDFTADASLPGWQTGARRSPFPPVFGGFPLLDDVTDGREEEAM